MRDIGYDRAASECEVTPLDSFTPLGVLSGTVVSSTSREYMGRANLLKRRSFGATLAWAAIDCHNVGSVAGSGDFQGTVSTLSSGALTLSFENGREGRAELSRNLFSIFRRFSK